MSKPEIDLERIAEVLLKHEVDYVLVGGMAVVLHGGDTTTQVVDLAFDASDWNVERLADALQELGAKPKRWLTESFRLHRSDLAAQWLHLESAAGDIDLIHRTPGVRFDELRQHVERFPIGGAAIWVASMDDLIKLKSLASRDKDGRHIAELKAIREMRDRSP